MADELHGAKPHLYDMRVAVCSIPANHRRVPYFLDPRQYVGFDGQRWKLRSPLFGSITSMPRPEHPERDPSLPSKPTYWRGSKQIGIGGGCRDGANCDPHVIQIRLGRRESSSAISRFLWNDK